MFAHIRKRAFSQFNRFVCRQWGFIDKAPTAPMCVPLQRLGYFFQRLRQLSNLLRQVVP